MLNEKIYVSIPFKRESVLQVASDPLLRRKPSLQFQFPSNGKVYCKERHRTSRRQLGYQVSIPFKRESVLQGFYLPKGMETPRFNSLQTGKCIASLNHSRPRQICKTCFNSLQTGKCIARQHTETRGGRYAIKFQFPSNGKVYCKKVDNRLSAIKMPLSFNSLQTGKCIARDPILSPVGPWLQNPKNIRELRGTIFLSKFCLKIPQTRVYTETYTIF